jgi:hypothetical protein
METAGKLNGMGTWRRYKLGQAQFTNWLTQTAEKLITPKTDHGTADDAGPDTPQQSRRQKKKAKASAAFTFDTGSDKFVHWSQLEVLAQRVTDHATPEDVPDAAVNILRDVVALRKKSFSFFSSSAKDTKDEKLKQSNANHAHIISVLERVLAKLEALVKARGSRERTGEPKDSSRVATSDLSNMFAYLDVQTAPDAVDDAAPDEPEDEPVPATANGAKRKGGKKAQKPKKPEKHEKAVAKAKGGTSWVDNFRFGLPGEDDDEDDEFDLYMMVYCFFEDFNAIRNHVAERWCDYWYDRSVPLDTLAVVTNAAFELFHQLESDLVRELRPLNPRLARYDFMMSMLFYHYGIDHVDYDSYDDLSEEESDDRIWRDEADWLGLASYYTLQQTLEMIPPGKVPMTAPSVRTPIVYGANNAKDWRDFQHRVTHQIITEGAHLKALKVNQQEPVVLPTESLLLLDFQDCLRLNGFSSALIFSLHLWVDIRHIMEADHDKPFEELQGTAVKLKQALEAHNPTKYCKDHDFKRRWLTRTWETKHYMVEDFLFEDKKARFRQIGIHEDPEPFFLLKHEPVWTGLLDFRARLVYSQLGHEFIMLSSIVDAAAHLYHAAIAADPTLPKWEEMSKYVDTYADGSQFKLGIHDGRGAAAIIRNFVPQASGQRGEKSVALIDGDKMYVSAIAVRQSLYDRYARDETRAPFVDYLRELSTQRWEIERDERQEGRALTGPSPEAKHDHGRNANGDSTELVRVSNGVTKTAESTEEEFRRKASLSQLSPVEMLQLLDDTVTSQVNGLLTLDYFKLFDQSVALLEAVVAEFGPEMDSRLGARVDGSHAYLERLAVLLAEDLGQSSDPAEKEIVDTFVRGCRVFFRAMETVQPEPGGPDNVLDPAVES